MMQICLFCQMCFAQVLYHSYKAGVAKLRLFEALHSAL